MNKHPVDNFNWELYDKTTLMYDERKQLFPRAGDKERDKAIYTKMLKKVMSAEIKKIMNN